MLPSTMRSGLSTSMSMAMAYPSRLPHSSHTASAVGSGGLAWAALAKERAVTASGSRTVGQYAGDSPSCRAFRA